MRIRYDLVIILTLLVILQVVAKNLYNYNILNIALSKIKSFFYQPSHPVNLSIFRIVLFSLIFTHIDLHQLILLSHVPKQLIFPPKMLFWSLDFIPISEKWITISYLIFYVTCILSIVGLFTQFSIFATTVLSFYLLGIPNFFGKVDHYHHLVLFATIMIVSRCSDVWSVDALLKSKKSEYMPKPSILYGFPVRVIWLIFGVLYFFPGFWKAFDGGLGHWIFSDTLKFIMYDSWYASNFIPFFRLDYYPLLYKFSALLTVLFETSFIFFLFLGRVRYFVIIGGLIFHCLTYAFLKIYFLDLQICYVIFFDFTFLYDWYTRSILNKNYVITSGSFKESQHIPYVVALIGGILVLGNVYSGLRDYEDSWYFSCYPTFAGVQTEASTTIMSIQIDMGDGVYKELDWATIKKINNMYGSSRYYYISKKIANSKDNNLFKAFWYLMTTINPTLKYVKAVRLYEYKVSTVPEEKLNDPIAKNLLYEYHKD